MSPGASVTSPRPSCAPRSARPRRRAGRERSRDRRGRRSRLRRSPACCPSPRRRGQPAGARGGSHVALRHEEEALVPASWSTSACTRSTWSGVRVHALPAQTDVESSFIGGLASRALATRPAGSGACSGTGGGARPRRHRARAARRVRAAERPWRPRRCGDRPAR